MSESISVEISSVPAYLREGNLYKSFTEFGEDPENPETGHSGNIPVPRDCFKSEPSVSTVEDLRNLLKCLRFWIVDKLSYEPLCSILDFAGSDGERKAAFDSVVEEYEEDMPWMRALQKIISIAGRGDRLMAAMKAKDEDLLKYFFEHNDGSQLSSSVAVSAVAHGNVSVLKHYHENGGESSDLICSTAAAIGVMDPLRFCVENDFPRSPEICTHAVKYGHLDVLQYLYSQGIVGDSNTVATAAKGGYLECLKFLHEKSTEWDAKTCMAAAASGHLDCLKYAHQQGCPWDVDSVISAAYSNNQALCAEYVQSQEIVSS
mmetsp:Transcript_33324/g.55955  ORF Transcript_33324/g.55955 Transcript_33324/m.55955 type:complete len:318 (+) Transcript_33324:59-1012(+)|eukprot:CAMPEP_0174975454 /NCGR_PEP_ID=MMETSP0004_2-20121128/12454_1 /TAXON_ID=420556 /ORGANISM="Ochromonas sp., Strain CCMP1393" /LENGTH=317 /DNA_ID=CAMNT_0016226311 /DNA_START=38 /DNA_END=991 /DNA_ORIENTATION=+